MSSSAIDSFVPRLLAVLLLGACAPADVPDAGPTPEEVAAGLLPAVVFEGEAPQTFSVEARMAHYNVPGVSVAVLDGGEVAWARGWGAADMETGAPVTPETLFQAASISKPVAALAALGLVEEGTLSLDAPVNEFLTSWKVPDNDFTADSAVTLRGLLTHTAGLTVWGFPGYRKDEAFAPGQAVATNRQVLEGEGNTAAVRVYKVPGTSWQYSGGGYTVMEQMVEDVTGLPFDEAMRVRVLEPAGMLRSTYAQPLPEDRWPEAARAHLGSGDEVEGEWHSYPEQAAAGLWTTPTELLTLSAHLLAVRSGALGDGVISREMLDAMLTPHRSGEEGFSDYGLGFGIQGQGDDLRFGHGGSNAGFKAQWTVLANRGQGVVVMTNGDRGSALAQEVIRSVAAAYAWPIEDFQPRVRARRAAAAETLTEYAGEYLLADRPGFVVSIRVGDGVLVVSVPGQGESDVYPAVEEDTFFDRDDGSELRFTRDEEGAVTGVENDGGIRLVRQGA